LTPNASPEMSGLSYFAIRIQSWNFKAQSKSSHSPKSMKNLKSNPIKSIKLTFQ